MEREQDRVVVEGGAILERNTRGTRVLTARHLSPKLQGLLQLQIQNWTKQQQYLQLKKALLGPKRLAVEQVYHVYHAQESLPPSTITGRGNESLFYQDRVSD